MKKTDKITVETSVTANLDKTWDYWTSPEHIKQWNQASDDWHCPKAANDLWKGGRFSATMASKDGKMSFDFEGVYDDVIKGEKIAYTMPDGRQVEVSFASDGKTTHITEIFDPERTNSPEMQQQGWQAILDNFKKHVETS